MQFVKLIDRIHVAVLPDVTAWLYGYTRIGDRWCKNGIPVTAFISFIGITEGPHDNGERHIIITDGLIGTSNDIPSIQYGSLTSPHVTIYAKGGVITRDVGPAIITTCTSIRVLNGLVHSLDDYAIVINNHNERISTHVIDGIAYDTITTPSDRKISRCGNIAVLHEIITYATGKPQFILSDDNMVTAASLIRYLATLEQGSAFADSINEYILHTSSE
jgi:hypothetical protein